MLTKINKKYVSQWILWCFVIGEIRTKMFYGVSPFALTQYMYPEGMQMAMIMGDWTIFYFLLEYVLIPSILFGLYSYGKIKH